MTTNATPVAKVASYAFWARDGKELAAFYAAALGWKLVAEYPDEQGVPTAYLIGNADASTRYTFYTARDYQAPAWPQDELPFHLDLSFDDVEAGEKRLLELGATKPDHQPGGGQWTVLLDPSGQPFCISVAANWQY
ncbi:VOC family protein [Streptomyces alboflavus]|uniref:VOC family protein n=1 Tax=Streptomyces alboflavus TaxID=67267 RepID=UPI0036CFB24C